MSNIQGKVWSDNNLSLADIASFPIILLYFGQLDGEI